VDQELWITIATTAALVLGPAGVALVLWRAQVRHERRDRAVELYRHYEDATMKAERRRAWLFLDEQGADCAPMSSHFAREHGEAAPFHACFSVASFFRLVYELAEKKQIDPGLTAKLFEQHRRDWRDQFAAMAAAGERDNVDRTWFEWRARPLGGGHVL
jgi:hypothetical protein